MSTWPDIPYEPWRETCRALHLFVQIIGKYRLAHTPWLNHAWHATLLVSGRGLTTSPIPDGPGGIEIVLDLIDHAVIGTAGDGGRARFALEPMSVAGFEARFRALVSALGGTPKWHGRPNELPDPVPFAVDTTERPYDADAATRFFQAISLIEPVLKQFRTGFIGKTSPVHLFWGSFDLAVTRFSGRRAPEHPGGIPFLPDAITRESYSHEVSSAGFWPGDERVPFPTFYSYAYPPPEGFAGVRVRPAQARFDSALGEFILPYDEVRRSGDPAATLTEFLESTYRAAADLGGWDRRNLECLPGEPGRPRPL